MKIPRIYPNLEEKVTPHHDKTTKHVSILKIQYLEKLRSEGHSNYIRKEVIPTKSPDKSPVNLLEFG